MPHKEPATLEVRFRVGLHGRPGSTMPDFAEVHLILQDSGMLATATGARVTTERRNELDVPEKL